MKTYKIGKLEFNLCETANDLNAYRYKELKDYLLMKETGHDVVSLSKQAMQFRESINQNDLYSVAVSFNNFLTGLQQVKDKKDPYHYLFALIVTEKDEVLNEFSESMADEKLTKMFKAGLTQGEIEEIVNLFLKSSSTHYVSDFLMILESLKIKG